MHQAFKDGVGDGGIGEKPMPLTHRNLTGDERGPGLRPVVDHLEKIMMSLAFQGRDPPVV